MSSIIKDINNEKNKWSKNFSSDNINIDKLGQIDESELEKKLSYWLCFVFLETIYCLFFKKKLYFIYFMIYNYPTTFEFILFAELHKKF